MEVLLVDSALTCSAFERCRCRPMRVLRLFLIWLCIEQIFGRCDVVGSVSFDPLCKISDMLLIG